MKSILLIDNFDSFTYNLVHYLEQCCEVVDVKRNNEIPFDSIGDYEGIVYSPGPGLPDEAGDMKKLIKTCASTHPQLGICLGMQAMWEVLGGKLTNLDKVLHGISGKCELTSAMDKVFENIPDVFDVGHYHSWVCSEEIQVDEVEITAKSQDKFPMAFKHKIYPMRGFQFHPESVLTPLGFTLLKNWVNLAPLEVVGA